MGIIEELPEKGIVKYAKPAGVIASLIPVTSPYITPDRHRHLRDQVQGRGDLLAAPVEPQHDQRDRAADARSAAPAGRAGRPPAVRRASEHSAGERADGEGGSDHRHRRPGDGEERPTDPASPPTASAPAMRRWSSTRPPTSPRRRATPASARPTTTARAAPRTATCSSTPRIYDAFLDALQREGGYLVDEREKALLQRRLLGRRGPADRRHHRAAGQDRRRARRVRAAGRQDLLHRPRAAHRQAAPRSRPRSSAPCSPSSSSTASTMRSTRCGRFSRPAARVIPAGSTRSTMRTSTRWHWSRR